jgi:hypothetical protein
MSAVIGRGGMWQVGPHVTALGEFLGVHRCITGTGLRTYLLEAWFARFWQSQGGGPKVQALRAPYTAKFLVIYQDTNPKAPRARSPGSAPALFFFPVRSPRLLLWKMSIYAFWQLLNFLLASDFGMSLSVDAHARGWTRLGNDPAARSSIHSPSNQKAPANGSRNDGHAERVFYIDVGHN